MGLMPVQVFVSKVEVPAIPCPLNDISLQQLRTHMDPFDANMHMLGIGLYLTTMDFVLDHIIEKK
jgi:Pyruvate/2-oxoacid:ferredoxin oxidoreductase gamma subunit